MTIYRDSETGPRAAARRVLDDITLDRAPTAPANARHWMLRLLHKYELPNSVWDDAMLVVSELVTNAYLHTTSTDIKITVSRWAGLHIEVRDGSDRQPNFERSPDPGAESGHGLQLVRAVAAHCGQFPCPTGSGKAVWVVLPLPSNQ
jgi:anti-sigma regulatory factor (Ser/Thr protein kinase)